MLSSLMVPQQTPPAVPAEGLLRLLMGFEASQVLMTAHELGVFEALQKSPLSFAELCGQRNIPISSGRRLLQACVALGLLELRDGQLSNGPLPANYLIPGSSCYLGGLVEYYQGEFYSVYGKLDQAIKQNHPQVQSLNGATDLFSALPQQPELRNRFFEALHRLGTLEGGRLAEIFPFKDVRHLTDLGGGSGALSISVARAFPHLEVTLFDLPAVCTVAGRYIEEARLDHQVQTQTGDFWKDPLPERSDAILLSMVLHDWSLAEGRKLLERCFNALPHGGYILIYEQMLNDDRCGPVVTCLTDLTMLLRTDSGAEYTEADYRQLLSDVGFVPDSTLRTTGVRQLLHARKP